MANCLYIYNDEKPDIPEVTLDQDINGYYLIRDIKDFAQINRDPRADYRLANNIDAAGKPVEAVMTFDGTLDGDGHTINNLLYASPTSRGLIELLGPGGVIQDLTITNAVLESTASDVGILAGQSSGIIRNVNVSGEVKGTGTVGGLLPMSRLRTLMPVYSPHTAMPVRQEKSKAARSKALFPAV